MLVVKCCKDTVKMLGFVGKKGREREGEGENLLPRT